MLIKMSMLNPGTSINFDGRVLEEEAEAELDKEDQKCQQELRDLLTTALPDDLLDDDDGSSSLSSSLSPDKTQSPQPWELPQQQLHQLANNLDGLHGKLQQQQQQQQTSTPQGAHFNLPPLKTPAAYQCNNVTASENQHRIYISTDKHQTTEYNHHVTGFDRGEIEGADSDDEYNHKGMQRKENHHNDNGLMGYQQQSRDYCGDGVRHTERGDNDQQYGHGSDEICNSSKEYVSWQSDFQCYGSLNEAKELVEQPHDNKFLINQNWTEVHKHQVLCRPKNEFDEEKQSCAIDQTPVYQLGTQLPRLVPDRLQYRGDGSLDVQQKGMLDGVENQGFAMVPVSTNCGQGDNARNIQQQFLETVNHMESGQTAQLQILYQAKSRELDEVTREQERQREEMAKEKRILNHQVALANVNHMESGQTAQLQILYQAKSRELDEVTREQERQREEMAKEKRILNHQVALANVNHMESGQTAQLQILYQAKSRELDEVTREQERQREEMAKEKRILNHQVALANGERDGAVASLDQSREMFMTCKKENVRLEEQLQAKCDQVQTLTITKDELMEKLHSAECTIENLAQQLQDIQVTEANLKFSREQENVLTSIQERYEQEMNTLKEKLDKANTSLTEKNSDLKTLQEELSSLRKTMDQTRIEHGEVVNKLAKSLDESQAQCRLYLKSGSIEEISQLKHQLKLANSARDLSQDMSKSLQEELQDLKEQVQMYQSAANLGVLPNTISPKTSESFAHLGVRNLDEEDWETPKIHRSSEVSTQPDQQTSQSEDLVLKLRTELERALRNNRCKRNQVCQLQDQLKTVRGEYGRLKQSAEETQFHAKELEDKLQMMQLQNGGRIGLEETSERYRDQLSSNEYLEAHRNTSELESLKDDCETLKQKLEQRVQENKDLKQQMVDMVNEHDDDKQRALQRAQNTCIQLHEDRSKQLREHMVSEWEAEREMLKEKHQLQIQELRAELETAQTELCEVKEMYLVVCEEKKKIEDEVTRKLTAYADNQLTKTKEELNADKDKAVEDVKQALQNNYQAKLLNAKAEWQKEANELTNRELELKLAEAHVEWNANARKQAVESARKALEAEWQTKLDLEVEKKLTEQLDQAKTDLESKYQKDTAEQISKIEAVCEEKYKTTLQARLTEAELEWKKKSEKSEETEKELKDLRVQLQTSRNELQKTEYHLKREVKYLKSRLTCANAATMEAMEGRIAELQNKHAAVLSRLKKEHQRERERWNRDEGGANLSTICQETQTDQHSDDTRSSDAKLNELRAHYLTTVQRIRGDVLKYVTDMREECRHTVHTEVARERRATAKKLRQYYLQCLHQLMKEDQLKLHRDTSVSKFVARAQALELPDEDVYTKDVSGSSGVANHNVLCGNSAHESKVEPHLTREKSDSSISYLESSDDGSECFGPLKLATSSARSSNSSAYMLQIGTPTDECPIDEDKQYTSFLASEASESDSLMRLPRQPREFNPSPERLMCKDSSNPSCFESRTNTHANITVRLQSRSLSKSKCSVLQENKKDNPTVNNTLKANKTTSSIGCNDTTDAGMKETESRLFPSAYENHTVLTQIPLTKYKQNYMISGQTPIKNVSSSPHVAEYTGIPNVAAYPTKTSQSSPANQLSQTNNAEKQQLTELNTKLHRPQGSSQSHQSKMHGHTINKLGTTSKASDTRLPGNSQSKKNASGGLTRPDEMLSKKGNQSSRSGTNVLQRH